MALTIQNTDAAMEFAALDVARSDKRTKCAMRSPSRRIRILVKKEGRKRKKEILERTDLAAHDDDCTAAIQ